MTRDDNIEEYKDFCSRVAVPLFAQPYWLDAVCPGEWDVMFARKSGRVAAAMPWHGVRRLGRRFMLQPQLTQFLGPQVDFALTNESHYRRRSLFRECATDIIGQIASQRFAYVQMAMHHTYTDWLPFHWAGYRETTRYTYLLPDISSPDEVVRSFHPSKRGHLRTAAADGLVADCAMGGDEFRDFHARCLATKGQRPVYAKAVFDRLAATMAARGQCAFIAVRGRGGDLQSAVFVVWDDTTAYQLMSCTDVHNASAGASTFAVEQAIRFCSSRVKAYDFEGSMMQDVEFSYSKYGTVQRPYIYLERYSSLAMEIALRLAGKTR